jgi:glycosyltransferase involved in cell wall biosynthesis/nucleotide-binding universal stress UspA family protein
LEAARWLSQKETVSLLGLVPVAKDDSLSTGANRAQALRRSLQSYSIGSTLKTLVTHDPWAELRDFIVRDGSDLVMLSWPTAPQALGLEIDEILADPPCDLCLVRGVVADPKSILVPVRGGPHAELALRLALAGAAEDTSIRSLHIRVPKLALTAWQKREARKQDAAFRGIASVLANLPDVEQVHLDTENAALNVLRHSKKADLVIMGASASHSPSSAPLGDTAERVMNESPAAVIVVKTKRKMPSDVTSEVAGQRAISVLVDKWFGESTYHADEFADLDRLRELKERQGLTISLALPALNEEQTVGKVIKVTKSALMDKSGLVDEIVLIDSGSTDKTRQIASDLGVPVHIHQQILPKHGARIGKGEALWKSLHVTKGDLIFWIDTDIDNINPRFVYGLIGPLLADPELQFVKGFYRRPIRRAGQLQAGEGGRVTELTARPLLNLFFPELSGIVQPLSGEYGGRRSALETLGFFSGYGVETGLLIDIFEKYGLGAIGQVDLQERIHHNQPLEALSMMSFAIIQVVISKLEKRYGRQILEDVNKTMKLIRYADERFFLDVEDLTEQERPAINSLAEYRQRN